MKGHAPLFIDATGIQVDRALFECERRDYEDRRDRWLHATFLGAPRGPDGPAPRDGATRLMRRCSGPRPASSALPGLPYEPGVLRGWIAYVLLRAVQFTVLPRRAASTACGR